MELQISYRICTKVQKESVFWRETGSNQRNIEDVMPVEGSRDWRRRGMPGSHPYVGKYPAQDERIGIHGVSKREKQLNDIPEVREYEICISEQGILFWCKGYYVDTVGKNTKAIKEYIENQLKVDRESDQLSIHDPRDPFTGSK